MKTKTSTKKMDLNTIKPLSRAEQAKVLGGSAAAKADAEDETENFVGIAIAAAGAFKALGPRGK